MSDGEWPPEIVGDLGFTVEEWEAALTALRDYRCWKKIPRCFNGWGVGICALPNRHEGDCNPMPDMTKKEA